MNKSPWMTQSVIGPDGSLDGHLAVFDGVTGKLVKDGGSPGSGGLLQIITVTLNNEDIKALPTTPIQIVPAPGLGRYVLPIAANVILNNSAGAYTNVSPNTNSWNIGWQGSSLWYASGQLVSNALGAANASPIYGDFMFPGTLRTGTGDFAGELVTTMFNQPLNSIENLPLVIKDDWNGNTNYTGGNVSNTMKVTTLYAVMAIT